MKSTNDVISLGVTSGRASSRSFGIRRSDRLFHMICLGQTGTGKSTLLLNMIRQDMAIGQAFCLIDPHGDLALEVAESSGSDVFIWNLASEGNTIGFNPLNLSSAQSPHLVASALIEAFKKQWEDAWGARMEHLLRYALLALLERSESTLQDIMPMFLNKEFRSETLARISDPQVRYFWESEYPAMNYRSSADGVAPIANKLGAFLAHPLVRKAVCVPEQPMRLVELLANGKSLVVNLSRGLIGSDISNLVGGLLVSCLSQAAFQRQILSPAQRNPYFLYVDEFHSFTTEAFADMLSGLRKYGLGVVATTQYLSGMSNKVRDAVFGNVGNIVAFRLGAPDASVLFKHFGYEVPSVSDLVNLPNYECYARIMINGAQSKPFSAKMQIWDSQEQQFR